MTLGQHLSMVCGDPEAAQYHWGLKIKEVGVWEVGDSLLH